MSKVVETARTVLARADERILLLSKIRGPMEFPGGKRVFHTSNFWDDMRNTAALETEEETGLVIPSREFEYHGDHFYYTHQRTTEWDAVETLRRQVIVFGGRISQDPIIHINAKLDEYGDPEDNHQGYKWVSPYELHLLRRENGLSKNSSTYDLTLQGMGIRTTRIF